MLSNVLLLVFVGASSGSFLLNYQEQFSALSKRVTWELTAAHETNRVQNRLLRRDVLAKIGIGTVALRTIRFETNQTVAALRRRPNADQECLDSVDTSLDSMFHKSERMLQQCVTDLVDTLQTDFDNRFYAVAMELQRESTYMLKTVLDSFGEVNPMLFLEDIEGRLDAELDHFNQAWLAGQYKLQEDLEMHTVLTDKVVGIITSCADGMVNTLPLNVNNIINFAEDYCLS